MGAAPRATTLLPPVRRVLQPLVRLLIRAGVTFPMLADLLRGLYVEVALREVLGDARSRTDSRISLITGIHRKEIRHLRESEAPLDDIPAALGHSSLIVARWLGTPATSDGAGGPRPLPRTADTLGQPSFESLVTSVTTDVRPRAVLDDFLAQGLVTKGADGLIHLHMAAFLPRPGDERQLFYFGRNLADHLAAASANVMATGPAPYFDRSVHYDGLTAAQAATLEAAARKASQTLLLEINRMALAMLQAAQAESPSPATRRVNLGVYIYADDAQIQAADTQAREP
jgi:hypothetical protein